MRIHQLQEDHIISEAGLDASALIRRPWRVQKFLNMVKEKQPFTVERTGEQVLIDPTTHDELKAVFDKLLAGEKISKIQVRTSTGEIMAIGNLKKTTEFGGGAGAKGYNVGNLAEGLLGVALTARFVNNKPVTEQHITRILENIKNNTQGGKLEYIQQGKKAPIAQATYQKTTSGNKIKLLIKLDKLTMDALMSEDRSGYIGALKSAQLFANKNKQVQKQIDHILNDPDPNRVEVLSDGLSEQTGTKVDVRVKIDGKPVKLNISLKASDVEQFGQKYGTQFETVKEFMHLLFGVTLPASLKKEWDGGAPVQAASKAYFWVKDELNRKLKNASKTTEAHWVKDLARGIQHFARGGEKDVVLVALKNAPTIAGYDQLNFNNLEKKLDKLDLAASIKTSATTLATPTIYVHEKDDPDNVLLKARLKVEDPTGKPIFRNLVEMGKLLKELAGDERFEMTKTGEIVDKLTGKSFATPAKAEKAIRDKQVGKIVTKGARDKRDVRVSDVVALGRAKKVRE
jgi:ribosomal protein L35